MSGTRSEHLKLFYSLLEEATHTNVGGSPPMLAEVIGAWRMPPLGVYFFMEDGEFRHGSGMGPRVVRVGTHGLTSTSKATLRGRLGQHRGTRDGRGNHRGSIFRLLVGTALLARSGTACPSWGVGGSPPKPLPPSEVEVERLVSETIGQMRVTWLAIEDAPGPTSLRGYIERNAIALLSGSREPSPDPPSSTWLGHFCQRKLVPRSGLWNQNHVDEIYDPRFLDDMRRIVSAALQKS